jgi:hypothetical protein
MDTELIRRAYKPDKVRLLMVGESPPAKGGFFYLKDRKILMVTYTGQAFQRAHGLTFRDNEQFLNYFKECGCYLDDLCTFPVDDLSASEREKCLRDSIEGLAQRIQGMQPPVIAIVLKRIEGYVRDAIRGAGCCPEVFLLPFPGNGHQNKYIEHLAEIVGAYTPSK